MELRILLYFYITVVVLVQHVVSSDHSLAKQDDVPLVRHKRMLIKDKEWTNGIVPYIYDTSIDASAKNEILAAIDYVQKYTCITFVPLTNDTRSTYNLDHDGYVRFINKGS
ncbi:hypothetical protein SNE40_007822 [Patella caerulea]|uniref:Peptidase M12A domain-containing protein n=1 Tax=Patella caerulea TaxID=87958 RepID=A0AAN8K0L8_PATCE